MRLACLQVCTGNMRSTKGNALKPWKNMEALQVCDYPASDFLLPTFIRLPAECRPRAPPIPG